MSSLRKGLFLAALGVLVALGSHGARVTEAHTIAPQAGAIIAHKHCIDTGDETFNLILNFEFEPDIDDGGEPLDEDERFDILVSFACNEAFTFSTDGQDQFDLTALFEWWDENSGALTAATVVIIEGSDDLPEDITVFYDGCGPVDLLATQTLLQDGVVCVITNAVGLSGISVQKACVGDGFDAGFTIEVVATEIAPVPEIPDNAIGYAPIGCGQVISYPDLLPGEYEISEEIDGPDAADFSTRIICSDGTQAQGSVVSVTLELDESISCVIINVFNPDGVDDGGLDAIICACFGLDIEIDIDNTNTNTIGIGNTNTNSNANANDNSNDNENKNDNKNNNENTNQQNQENTQDQDNKNTQTNNITSSPEVNIDFD